MRVTRQGPAQEQQRLGIQRAHAATKATHAHAETNCCSLLGHTCFDTCSPACGFITPHLLVCFTDSCQHARQSPAPGASISIEAAAMAVPGPMCRGRVRDMLMAGLPPALVLALLLLDWSDNLSHVQMCPASLVCVLCALCVFLVPARRQIRPSTKSTIFQL